MAMRRTRLAYLVDGSPLWNVGSGRWAAGGRGRALGASVACACVCCHLTWTGLTLDLFERAYILPLRVRVCKRAYRPIWWAESFASWYSNLYMKASNSANCSQGLHS